MSNVYLHSKNNNNSLTNTMLILFIPFILMGIYKNSITLHNEGYALLECLKPVLFILISLLITYIIKLIYKEKFWGNNLLENIIISLIAVPQTNIFVYLGLITGLNFLREYLRFNKALGFMILDIGVMMLLKNYTFKNVYEMAVGHNYNFFDFLMGKGIGGIGNTFLLASIIALCILCCNYLYKRGSSITALVTYYLLAMIYSFIVGEASINLLVNNNVIFACIFIVPISIYSPYSRGASYIYGILIGIFTFAFSFYDVNLGIYISILIMNYLSYLLDKFIVGKSNKNLIETL